jgi:hypothetical protein
MPEEAALVGDDQEDDGGQRSHDHRREREAHSFSLSARFLCQRIVAGFPGMALI